MGVGFLEAMVCRSDESGHGAAWAAVAAAVVVVVLVFSSVGLAVMLMLSTIASSIPPAEIQSEA